MISTSIRLEGDKEFKDQLKSVNSNLRTMDTELKLTTEQFKGQANSVEALEAKQRILNDRMEQQREKVRALEDAVKRSGEVYKDQPQKIDEYQQSLNRANAELLRTQRELADTDKYLDEARSSFDKTARSIDGFGNAVKDADDGKGKGLSGLVGSLGNLKNLLVGGAVVTGAKELGEALFEIVDGTKEYRQIMGGLEVSGEAAGYTAEQTAEAYRQLYGVLGDTQTAATTVANLQAIGLEQEDLLDLITITTGAWTKYGDSIPIDQIAESINLGAQQSEISSGLADALEWAGVNIEEFGKKLETANSTQERAELIMEELSKTGLRDLGEAYRNAEADIINANESQMKWDESVAKLGETLSPAADALRSFGADAIGWVTERIQEAIVWIQDLIEWFGNLNNSLNSRTENRMASYGYTKVDMPDGSYRWIDTSAASDLATANTQESPAASAMDMRRAMSQAVSYGVSAGSKGVERIEVVAEIDGREVGRAVHEYVRDEGKANPEVESDTL